MNIKTTLILAIVLAFLGGYYYFYEGNTDNTKNVEQTEKLLSIQQYKVKSFEYTNKSKYVNSAKFIKKDEKWFITSPIEYDADFNEVDKMLNSLFNSKSEEKIENADNLEDFGLKDPQIIFNLNTEEGNKIIKIGDQSPTKQNLYIMKDNKKDIYLIQGDVFYSVDKDLFNLRDKIIMKIEPNDISFIELKNNNNTFTLKKDIDNWNIIKPKKYKASNSEVEEILSKLKDNRVIEFLEEEPENSLKKYGLDNPLATLSVGKDESSEHKVFYIGSEKGDYNFAKTNVKKPVFKVSKATTDTLINMTLNNLRDKELLNFESSNVSKISIEDINLKVEAIKENGDWKITKNESKNDNNVSKENISEFVNKLSNLNFEQVINKESFSLGNRITNVTLRLKNSNNPIKLTFGGITEENKDQVYLLKQDIIDEGYTVSKSLLDILNLN